MTNKVSIVIASTRQSRVGETIGNWIQAQAEKAGVVTEIIDLKKINLPFFDAPVPPMYMSPTTDDGKAWAATIGTAERFIIVTPEYNQGYPASLKNAIDYLHGEWGGKPVGIVSYGYMGGGAAAAAQLASVLAFLKMEVAEQKVALPLGGLVINDGRIENRDAAFADQEASLAMLLHDITIKA